MRIIYRVLLAGVAFAFSNDVLIAEEPPLIVAHRGLLLHAPENTLANFRACLELRLGFEFDVEKTKDGHLVCIHDGTVDRTTNRTTQSFHWATMLIEALIPKVCLTN